MKKLILALTLLFSFNASAVLIHYDVELVSDADSVAFGGSTAGTTFLGTFSIDDSLIGLPAPVFDPGLTGSVLFFSFDIGGTIFDDTNVSFADNGLRFGGGLLLDIAFDLALATGETLSIFTAFEGTADWSATDVQGAQVFGDTFPTSVTFTRTTPVPEPTSLLLFALGLMGISTARKIKA